MKYTTKELMNMPQEKLEEICKIRCYSKGCPYKKIIQKYKEDGCCIKTCYDSVDKWIDDDQKEIVKLLIKVESIKNRIKGYKKFKKIMEKELNEK